MMGTGTVPRSPLSACLHRTKALLWTQSSLVHVVHVTAGSGVPARTVSNQLKSCHNNVQQAHPSLPLYECHHFVVVS